MAIPVVTFSFNIINQNLSDIKKTGLHKYLSTTNDWMLQLVFFYNAGKKAHSILKHTTKFTQELNLQDQTNETATCTLQAKSIKRKAKTEGFKQINETWENKPLPDRYPQQSQ